MLMMLAKGASIISIIGAPFLHFWPPMRPMTPHFSAVPQEGPWPAGGVSGIGATPYPALSSWCRVEPVSRASSLQTFQNRFKIRVRSPWHQGFSKDFGGPKKFQNLHHEHGPF